MGDILVYAWRTSKTAIVAVVLLLVAYAFILLCSRLDGFNALWQQYGDAPFTVMTLLVALLVWLLEVKEQYLANLPKRLTVSFVYKGREVMRCNDAILAHESDMRALAQQLGSQMTHMGRLPLRPMLENRRPEKRFDVKIGSYMHYETVVELWKLPSGKEEPAEPRNLASLYEEGKKLLWEPPFDESPEKVPAESSGW